MTREQALKEARKRFGKDARIQVYDKCSSPEARGDALATVKAARARIEAIEAEIAERLKALDWYQALRAEQKAERETIKSIGNAAMYYKFNVGKVSNVGGLSFYHVDGQGDTWEQAFAQADRGRVKRTA